MNFSQRRRKALLAASAIGAESLLITHPPDLRYLCGFTGSSGALALAKGKTRLFTDGRYLEQARKETVGTEIGLEVGPPALAAVQWLSSRAYHCVFDTVHTSVDSFNSMRRKLSSLGRRNYLLPATRLLASLREVKERSEIDCMRAAATLGCDLFEGMLSYLQPGVSEAEIAMILENHARVAGAEAMSFDTIVASGERSALPHGKASAKKLPTRGFVTLDFGVVLEGYCSDMTRTVHLGKPQAEARRVYDLVLEAQLAAVGTVRAGAAAGEIDEAARAVLRRGGLDQAFVHSTGHGLGLEIHEGPRLAANQKNRLQAGMVVTIEPGVYLPGQFGVRVEDMVLVTEGGREVLTPTTKVLIEL